MGRAGKDNRGHMTLLIRRVQIVLILNEILGIFFLFLLKMAIDTTTPDAGEQGTDHAMAKRVLRKIDRRLIPLLFTTYMFNFMDKTILSSASVFGMRHDTVRT